MANPANAHLACHPYAGPHTIVSHQLTYLREASSHDLCRLLWQKSSPCLPALPFFFSTRNFIESHMTVCTDVEIPRKYVET